MTNFSFGEEIDPEDYPELTKSHAFYTKDDDGDTGMTILFEGDEVGIYAMNFSCYEALQSFINFLVQHRDNAWPEGA